MAGDARDWTLDKWLEGLQLHLLVAKHFRILLRKGEADEVRREDLNRLPQSNLFEAPGGGVLLQDLQQQLEPALSALDGHAQGSKGDLLSGAQRQILEKVIQEHAHATGSDGKLTSDVAQLMVGDKDLAAQGLMKFLGVTVEQLDKTRFIEREFLEFVKDLKQRPDVAMQWKDCVVTGFESVSKPWTMQEIHAANAAKKAAIDQMTGEEVARKIENEVLDNLDYVLNATAASSRRAWPNGVRDHIKTEDGKFKVCPDRIKADGHGKSLDDFWQMKTSQDSDLSKEHVAALRIYTTSLFKYINNPLRNQTKPHPLPYTVQFIHEGIKKLRAAAALEAGATTSKDLWRGMRNLKMDDKFMQDKTGGAELAPMSTTTDMQVAAEYCMSDNSLLIKMLVDNFMQMGAKLRWLSAFPGEEEVLYPPLTYLQPTGDEQTVQVGNRKFQIIEVRPHIG